jgi:hypothetical protein
MAVEKGFWNFERTMEDPIEDIKYTRCGYSLHMGASMLIKATHAHLCDCLSQNILIIF